MLPALRGCKGWGMGRRGRGVRAASGVMTEVRGAGREIGGVQV